MNMAGLNVSAQMSNKATLARQIRRERAKVHKRPPIPTSFEALFNLPIDYTLATDGTKFLATLAYVDKEETKAMMVYISEHGKRMLQTFTVMQCDGNFSTCPKPFEQIYFIMACTPKGKAIPAAFVLLPGRTTAIYNAMFSAIEKAVGSNLSHLQAVVVDFELAVHNVIRDRYKQAVISGCLFHQRQAIDRQVKFKGLGSLYNQEATFQEAVQLFYSLAYVPEEDVEDCFYDVVMEFFENNIDDWDERYGVRQNVEEFGVYLELSYIAKKPRRGKKQPALFPISTWNKFAIYSGHQEEQRQEVPATNNAVEAYNSRLVLIASI